jgi:hypothetical protein
MPTVEPDIPICDLCFSAGKLEDMIYSEETDKLICQKCISAGYDPDDDDEDERDAKALEWAESQEVSGSWDIDS